MTGQAFAQTDFTSLALEPGFEHLGLFPSESLSVLSGERAVSHTTVAVGCAEWGKRPQLWLLILPLTSRVTPQSFLHSLS